MCADPNNLPFSNQAQQGLENKLVSLIAADLHLEVRYEWWAQRRGFARNTVASARCDLWPGVAAGIGSMATSVPLLPLDLRIRHAPAQCALGIVVG